MGISGLTSRGAAAGFVLRSSACLLVLLGWVYVIIFAALALMSHDSFGTGLDLAIYDHYVSNFALGQLARNTIIEASTIWNFYFAPLLIIFVPFYALFSDARTLLVLQTLALAGSVFPIYWYAYSRLGQRLAFVVALSFFLYPAVEFVNLSQFHVISLSVPLLSFALFFLLRQRYVPFLVCAILLSLVKEEAAFVVFGLGLYILVVQRRRWLGLAILVLVSVWFLALINYLFPWLTGRDYFFARPHLFGHLGTNSSEIVHSLFYQVDRVWNLLASSQNLAFILDLLFPLAFIPFAGADLLLIALPFLGMTFLTNTPWLTSHYPAPLIPCIYFAAISGLSRLLSFDLTLLGVRFDPRRRTREIILGVLLIGASLLGDGLVGPLRPGGRFDLVQLVARDRTAATTARQLASQVPPGATVVAQEELSPHFSTRQNIYVFPTISDYRQADYLVAKRDLFLFHKGIWDNWMSTGYFDTLVEKDEFIFARRKAPEQKLNIKFGDGVALLGYSLVPREGLTGNMVLRPIVEWRAEKAISEQYRIALQVVDSRGHVWSRVESEPQDGALPTNQWLIGKSIGDQYALDLPPTMPTGDYQIALEVHRADSSNLEAFDAQGVSLGAGAVMATVHIEKNKTSITASELSMGQRLFVDMREMRFLGYEFPFDRASPGDPIQLGLYWRARSKPQGDYLVAIQLRDAHERVVFEQKNRPADGTFSTTQWDAGEVLLDWHDWIVPQDMTSGEYRVYIVLRDAANGTVIGEAALTTLTIVKP